MKIIFKNLKYVILSLVILIGLYSHTNKALAWNLMNDISYDIPYTVGVAPVQTPPIAYAGDDQSITVPESSINVSGTGTDSDGIIVALAWDKISGGPATITTPETTGPGPAVTSITGLSQGSYTFRLTATDDTGLTGFDEMTVTVTAPTPTNGVCLPAHYSCYAGTSSGGAGGANGPWTWNCLGLNGGLPAACSQTDSVIIDDTPPHDPIDGPGGPNASAGACSNPPVLNECYGGNPQNLNPINGTWSCVGTTSTAECSTTKKKPKYIEI